MRAEVATQEVDPQHVRHLDVERGHGLVSRTGLPDLASVCRSAHDVVVVWPLLASLAEMVGNLSHDGSTARGTSLGPLSRDGHDQGLVVVVLHLVPPKARRLRGPEPGPGLEQDQVSCSRPLHWTVAAISGHVLGLRPVRVCRRVRASGQEVVHDLPVLLAAERPFRVPGAAVATVTGAEVDLTATKWVCSDDLLHVRQRVEDILGQNAACLVRSLGAVSLGHVLEDGHEPFCVAGVEDGIPPQRLVVLVAFVLAPAREEPGHGEVAGASRAADHPEAVFDPSPTVRTAAARGPLSEEAEDVLAGDESPRVRAALAGNRACSPETLDLLSGDDDPRVREAVAGNPATPPEALEAMAEDLDRRKDLSIARALASNPSTPCSALKGWLEDGTQGQRTLARAALRKRAEKAADGAAGAVLDGAESLGEGLDEARTTAADGLDEALGMKVG